MSMCVCKCLHMQIYPSVRRICIYLINCNVEKRLSDITDLSMQTTHICAHMCICVFHGILSQGVFSFFFILKSRDQVSFNDWVGRRKGNLKCWPLKHRRSKSYLVFFLGFFCKINYRMFMQLWWTLYSLSATNLSECYSLSEIGTIKSYLQMSRLLLVKGDKSQLAWEAVAKFALTFSTQAYKRALFQVK